METQATVRLVATVASLAGVILCLVAGAGRLFGLYYLAGFESMTLFNGGIALMVMGALANLELIYQRVK